MASCEQGTIEQASLHETPAPDASRDGTEATPLVKSNHGKQGKKKSVLIKSKAAVMILIWTALMSLIYGGFLNPENYFLLTYLLTRVQSVGPILNSEMIDSGIYAVFAFWLLFYPLAGYLADVRYGRYKVVRCSVCTMWCGVLTVVIGGIVNAIIILFINSMLLFIFMMVVNCALGFFLLISLLIGFAGFLANVIQFGVDQLNDSPSRDSFLFVHWFLFTLYIGISFGKLVWSAANATDFLGFSIFGLVLLVELICVPVTFCVAKRRWFVIGTGIGNPYKEVARVVSFARRNKIPIQRSAFTFWEDDIPTGLDLGKDKYGGPFTTEQQALIAVAYVFIYGGVFEFICAQSPHSMKGFLIGIFFAIKGLFQLIGVLGILIPFSIWRNSPFVGLVYFLVNIVISVAGVVVFIVAAKRYQYRQREEDCNVRKFIEEVYEKDVNHNQDFEDLDVHFSDSDSETQ
ncbi:solute carrier family 15 member 4-like isoform X1 [Halichondria panicea]|uniref:solute carrier family 15 member 4-like isoform X1 n=1 Tax=Halichondria panicea TaxID=6063 RepID=UPI00312B3EE7